MAAIRSLGRHGRDAMEALLHEHIPHAVASRPHEGDIAVETHDFGKGSSSTLALQDCSLLPPIPSPLWGGARGGQDQPVSPARRTRAA